VELTGLRPVEFFANKASKLELTEVSLAAPNNKGKSLSSVNSRRRKSANSTG